MRRKQSRPAFTLLEVLLALAIAVVLLAALYEAVDSQLKQAQAAREVVEQSALARNLLSRISSDLASTVSLSDPGRFRNQRQNSSGTGTTDATMATGTTTDPAASTDTTGTGNTQVVTLPLGIVGDATTLHLFVTKIPREAVNARSGDT